MTTNSYPAVGTGGLTESQWATLYGGDDGIIEDYVGTAFNLTFNDGTDTATVGVGIGSVNGYALEVTAGEDLFIADATTVPITYWIAIQYDPALNVAGGGGARSALGPCRLIVATTTLDTSGGKVYTLLYRVVRSPSQALSAAAITSFRRWQGPVVELDDYDSLVTGFGPFPRGTVLIESDTANIRVRTLNSAGTALEWQSVTNAAAIPFPAPGSLVAQDEPAEIYKAWGQVYMRGTLKRSSGNLNNGAEVILGTLPPGYRPQTKQKFITLASGPVAVGVRVDISGVVSMYDPVGAVNVTYIQLDNISFRAA